ncbi:MAG: glutamine-hydrolyzing carbamoyl-phosphate synthase small subunit [Spirochaetota bacterium]|nr:MAG: glutamine-hydrolyzing carbamoyl-phosphate synthase small subunit [Spirochaetota bacterium]
MENLSGRLVLEDGSIFQGQCFGYSENSSGEVVFNTGMVGYPESLTDPSYKGQILTFTYPLIGNYGIPEKKLIEELIYPFESDRIQVFGLIVSEHSFHYSHWNSVKSIDEWLKEYNIPALYGIDTRMLTKLLREHGTMLGKILISGEEPAFYDPAKHNLVAQVSIDEPVLYKRGQKKVILIDCGCKNNIIRSLLKRDISVLRVPWNHDFLKEEYHGIVISNGPGDPKQCMETVQIVKEAMNRDIPIFGICLGNQILALAAGGDTYKLKFGHRSQNQPCIKIGSKRCYITSQNHGYAVDTRTLPEGWEPWFMNANDGTNEGIRHRWKPFMSVQFHPEAKPGPQDTESLFDMFMEMFK